MADKMCAKLKNILDKAVSGIPLARAEVVHLLGLTDASQISEVFQTAQYLREQNFGNRIFLYGFVYFSTYCRNNCRFCSSRTSNRLARRYRKKEEDVVEAACLLAESGVHLIDLTMGEDPFFLQDSQGFETLLRIISRIKTKTGLPVMISPGVVPLIMLKEFANSGVDWYACYQETHSRSLFEYLRPQQDYDARLYSKKAARDLGILTEEGIMTGVGESLSDIMLSLETIRDLDSQQARVMSFVPQAGTPMSDRDSPPRLRELLTIAVLRLLFPDRLIPASLDVDGLDLLQERLDAGANVITSLIPPRLGLSGVSQPFLGIEEEQRTIKGLLPILEGKSLAPASIAEYACWVNAKKSGLHQSSISYEVTA
jgi:methylornithine synthase